MWNKVVVTLTLMACSTSAVYAGMMGEINTAPTFRPFILGEGSYSWPQIEGFSFTVPNVASINSLTLIQGWGGRLAAGVLHAMTPTYTISAEVGGGYYGHNELEPHIVINTGDEIVPAPGAIVASFDNTGLDILAGVFYTQPQYDLFFKAGALLENIRVNASFDPSRSFRDDQRIQEFIQNNLPDPFSVERNFRAVLPEIKLGGVWHMTDNWALDASWMHVFGGRLAASVSSFTLHPTAIGDTTISIEPPSLNVAMFGVEYRFG